MGCLFVAAELDRFSLADNAALTLTPPYSIALWCKHVTTSGTGVEYLLTWGTYSASPSSHLVWPQPNAASNSGKYSWRVEDSGGTSDGYYSSASHKDTAWHHLALVVTEAEGATQYLDGSASGTDNWSALTFPINAAAALFIGGFNVPYETFGGYLADIAKWNRELSSGEVAALAGGKTALWYPTSLAWYCPLKTTIAETIVGISITTDLAAGSGINAEHPTISDPPTFSAAWAKDCNRELGA